ncbi:cysteine desulfurase [Aeromicrobium sp.]|nr:cysteine desulfurase [Candidatus Saccharibacteria bacterium]
MSDPIYFDYAAATPLDPRVLQAMQPFYVDKFYNPSATYLAAKGVAHDLDAARVTVAASLGVRPAEIIFTAGGTEANNLAIKGVLEQYPSGNVVMSAVEHESVLAPAARHDHRTVAVKKDGTIDLVDLEFKIDEQTVLVSIMYANNEVGTIEPLKNVAEIIKRKRAQRSGAQMLPLYLHTDACQAANYLDLHVSRLGVDLLTLNGGKIYGPKQSGALYVGSHVQLQPQVLGGGQERGLRSGTENVAQCVGLAEALNIAQQGRSAEAERLQQLQRYFFAEIETRLPIAIINGSRKKRLPNNLHITIPGIDNERVLMQLDEVGILAAAGSACSASDEEPSHVLRAMGVNEVDAQASLRFTMGRKTTQLHIDELLVQLVRISR